MCDRIKYIEKERNSVEPKRDPQTQLLDADDDVEEFNIYKTQGGNSKHIIQTKGQNNKQEIINQLNQKIETMFKNNSQERSKNTKVLKLGNQEVSSLAIFHN